MDRIRVVVSSVANAPTYRFLQAGIFVVLGIAFATSFSSGSSGARILGYPDLFVSSVPLICDIVAALAMVVHGRVRDDRPMRRLAAWFVLVPMLLSWAANALDHLGRAPAPGVRMVDAPDKPPAVPALPQGSTWSQWAWISAVVLFAGLAPVAVAGLLHFMARYVEHQQRAARSVEELSQGTAGETDRTTSEIEPEFVEPAPLVRAVTVPSAAVETVPEVDPETVAEIDEIEIHRVMRDTKPRVNREVAVVMVRDKCSRATAYRRVQKETGDAALA